MNDIRDLLTAWEQNNKDIKLSQDIQKHILIRIAKEGAKRRINWIKVQAVFNLVLPPILIRLILYPRIDFRWEPDFILGVLLFLPVFTLLYSWSIRYFVKLRNVNFNDKLTTTQISLTQVEAFKLKITRLSYVLMPVAIFGLFLLCDFPIFSGRSLLPLSIRLIVLMVSAYYLIRYGVFTEFRQLKTRLRELEMLEH